MYVPGLELALVEWLKRGRAAEARLDPLTGRFDLSYSQRYRWTVAVFALISLGFLLLGIEAIRERSRLAVVYYALFGPMAALFGYIFRDAFFRPISFSDAGIFFGRRQTRFIPWTAVTEARHIKALDWIVLRAAGGLRVGVSKFRDGLITFAEYARRGDAPAAAALPEFDLDDLT